MLRLQQASRNRQDIATAIKLHHLQIRAFLTDVGEVIRYDPENCSPAM